MRRLRLRWPLLVEMRLPLGRRHDTFLCKGDAVKITNPGEVEPIVVIERTGLGRVKVTLRGDDERLTEHDLDLLSAKRPQPRVSRK